MANCELEIRPYDSRKDYKRVIELLRQGLRNELFLGIIVGLCNWKTLSILTILLYHGHGLSFFAFGLIIRLVIYAHQSFHLTTDLFKDGFFVAILKPTDTIVGCVSYKEITKDTAQIHRLTVDYNFRGYRIGPCLMDDLKTAIKNSGYKAMYLEVCNANFGAVKLFEKMNFHKIQDKNYIGSFLDLVTGLKKFTYIYSFGQENLQIKK